MLPTQSCLGIPPRASKATSPLTFNDEHLLRVLHLFDAEDSITMPHEPRQHIINESDLALDRYDGNIFVITMRKAPENRLNSKYAQKIIGAFNQARELLGTATEGAVITKGNDAKFWCTVGSMFCSTCSKALCQICLAQQTFPPLAVKES